MFELPPPRTVLSGWWFFPTPFEKYACSSKWVHLPQVSWVKIPKMFELPPPRTAYFGKGIFRWWVEPPTWKNMCKVKLDHFVQVVVKIKSICAMVKSRYIRDGHPTFNRNPYNGCITPYYWVDDHPLLYGNNGSLDPGTYKTFWNHQVGLSSWLVSRLMVTDSDWWTDWLLGWSWLLFG